MTILLVAHQNRKQNVSKYLFSLSLLLPFLPFRSVCHVTRFCSCYLQFLLIPIDVLIKWEMLFLGRTDWEVFCLVLWYIQSNDQINRNKRTKANRVGKVKYWEKINGRFYVQSSNWYPVYGRMKLSMLGRHIWALSTPTIQAALDCVVAIECIIAHCTMVNEHIFRRKCFNFAMSHFESTQSCLQIGY